VGALNDEVEPVDILAFGPHPDDIEIGVAGVLARHAASGHRVGLADLTAGEMGSNGTVEERLREAEAARAVLGARWRVNLELPDRGLSVHDDAQLRAVAMLVRRATPAVVLAPYWDDRHPDHVRASALVTEGVFSAGLRRYQDDVAPHKPAWICYYFINDSVAPSFVVDVSAHYDQKRRALSCYASQFAPDARSGVATRLTSPTFRQLIESRDAQFGALAGVAFAEGVVTRQPVVRTGLLREGGTA
jgi:bacillithiol biosynthesis deacetylase BshB1